MSKRKIGKCHICGEYKELSFEHVPPEKAFNNFNIKIINGKTILEREDFRFPWDHRNMKYRLSQRGMGEYTLCISCNNNTGGWYGDSYVDFVFQGKKLYEDNQGQKNIISNFKNIYPLRIIKQLITMLFSINSPKFAETHPDLINFVLNKELKSLNKDKYGLYIYYLKGEILRNVGIAGIIKFDKHLIRIVTELATIPFGFVFEIDPKPEIRESYNLTDIISLGNIYNYNENLDINLRIPVLEVNNYLPLDYRKRDEIFNDYITNRIEELLKKR